VFSRRNLTVNEFVRRTLLVVLLASLAAFTLAQEEGALPAGPGVDVVYAKCQQCHPLRYVTQSAGLPDFLWADTIALMIQLGMQVTEEEEEALYSYLTTYLGMNPPPEPSESEVAVAAEVDGTAAYIANCGACHGAEGAGVAGGFPPLVGHAAELAQADRAYLINLVLYGLSGPISVDGVDYNGMMPGWSHLSDDQIAAILNHVVTDWDEAGTLPPNFVPYAPEDVTNARGQGLTGADVYETRPSLP